MTEQHSRTSLLGKIAVYTEILSKDPRSTIFVSLSEAYRKMGLFDDAVQVIEQGLEIHPDFCPAHIIRARILCQQGDYQASEAEFGKALSLDSENLAGLVGYARLLILMGDETKARELLLEARALSPADPVINKLLLSLPEESEPEESPAEDQFIDTSDELGEEPEVTTQTQPSLASATLAELYLSQGFDRRALEIYRQLVLDEPNNLVLRRQIRDLEQKLSDTTGQEEPVAAISRIDMEEAELEGSAPSELEVVDSFEMEPDTSAVEAIPESVGAERIVSDDLADSAAESDRILVTLNQWLDNIQRRRSDV